MNRVLRNNESSNWVARQSHPSTLKDQSNVNSIQVDSSLVHISIFFSIFSFFFHDFKILKLKSKGIC